MYIPDIRQTFGRHSNSSIHIHKAECTFQTFGRHSADIQQTFDRHSMSGSIHIQKAECTGSSIWKSWIQPSASVLETFYDILKLSLVLTHSVGWALLLLGKKFDIPAQFDSKEWVFWSLLFLQNLRFDWFSVFLKNSFLLQMRINDQIQT